MLYYQWLCEMEQLLWQTLEQFLKELKIDFPYEPVIPQNVGWQGDMYIFVLVITFTTAKRWKQPKHPQR